MMPRKLIAARDQSLPARCRCGELLKLLVTKSPVRLYDELIVLRCAEHILAVDGVLCAEPIEEDWNGGC